MLDFKNSTFTRVLNNFSEHISSIIQSLPDSPGVYQYYDVPESIYSNLMDASSHGQYFDRNIKKAGYEFKKM